MGRRADVESGSTAVTAKKKFQTTAEEIPAVILGIDSAKISGWSIIVPSSHVPKLVPKGIDVAAEFWEKPKFLHVRRGLYRWGTARSGEDRAAAIAEAQSVASLVGLPLIVVLETWKGGKRKTPKGYAPLTPETFVGMGAEQGKWMSKLEDAGHPAQRTHKLDLGTWRKQTFGAPAFRTKATWKRNAVSLIKARYDVAMTDDEAESACIALVAQRWGKAFESLPKKIRETQKARAS